MVDARHRVEGVGDEPRAPIECRPGHLEVGLRMTDRNEDPGLDKHVDRLERSGQFGGEGDLAQGAAGRTDEPFDLVGRGLEQVVEVVGAAAGRREERALEVRAEHEWVDLGEVGDAGERFAELVDGVGDERDDRPGGAVGAVHRERRGNGRRPIVERVAAAAVAVQVDEAGYEPGAGSIDDLGLDALDHRR